MFATCLHCHGALGTNHDIESFPIGSRLAFDSAKGRLWVVCPSCERWNLSPLEERWEAVEQAESLYRGTQTRVATGEIGLAKLRSGMELIRIGRPLRPEFASWRYGRQLRSRFQRSWFARGMQAAEDHEVFESMAWATMVWTPMLIVTAPFTIARFLERRRSDLRAIRGIDVDGIQLRMRGEHLKSMRLSGDAHDRWRLQLLHADGNTTLTGDAVLPMLGRLLPHLNELGASDRQLDAAIAKVEHFREPARLLDFLTRDAKQESRPIAERVVYGQRLALEMMAHEEREHRAMEGELAFLRSAWEDAERIAAIADDLLLPASILGRLTRRDKS